MALTSWLTGFNFRENTVKKYLKKTRSFPISPNKLPPWNSFHETAIEIHTVREEKTEDHHCLRKFGLDYGAAIFSHSISRGNARIIQDYILYRMGSGTFDQFPKFLKTVSERCSKHTEDRDQNVAVTMASQAQILMLPNLCFFPPKIVTFEIDIQPQIMVTTYHKNRPGYDLVIPTGLDNETVINTGYSHIKLYFVWIMSTRETEFIFMSTQKYDLFFMSTWNFAILSHCFPYTHRPTALKRRISDLRSYDLILKELGDNEAIPWETFHDNKPRKSRTNTGDEERNFAVSDDLFLNAIWNMTILGKMDERI